MLLIQAIYFLLVAFGEFWVIQYQALEVGARQLKPLKCVDHLKNLRVFVNFLAVLMGVILADVLLELWLQVSLLLLVVLRVHLLHLLLVHHGSSF